MQPVRTDRIDSMQVIEWNNQMIKLDSWSVQIKIKPKLWFVVLLIVSNFPVKRRRHIHHTMCGVSRDACILNTHSQFKRYFCFEVVVCYSNLGKWLCSTNKNMHIAHTKPLSLSLPIFFFYIEIHAHKHIHTFEHRLEIGQIGRNKKWRRKKKSNWRDLVK